MEEKRKVGRPLITLDDLPNGWEELILKESEEGASIVELAVLLNVSKNTFYQLGERNPEFLTTIKRCKQLSEAWWVKRGRKELENKDFSYTGWYMNMKNRFDWSDKQKLDHTSNGKDINMTPIEFVRKSKD